MATAFGPADNAYVNTTLPARSVFSVGMRAKLNAVTAASAQMFFCRKVSGDDGECFFMNNGGLHFYSAGMGDTDTGAVVRVGTEHHFFYVRNGTSHQLWLDGVRVLNITGTPSGTETGLSIGSSDFAEILNGYVREFCLWEEALTESDARSDMVRVRYGRRPRDRNLWCWLPIRNAREGPRDYSGRAHNWTVTGAPGTAASPRVRMPGRLAQWWAQETVVAASTLAGARTHHYPQVARR